METWRQVAGIISVALLFVGEVTNAVDLRLFRADDDETFDFDIPALPLRSAAERFGRLIGDDIYIGDAAFESCSNFIVRPVVGRLTAQAAWTKLTAPICAASGVVIEEPGAAPVYMVDHPWVAEREIRIAKAPLIDVLQSLSDQFGGLVLEYRATDPTEGQTLLGPIAGHMGPEAALALLEAQSGSGFRHQRVGHYTFLLESSSADESSRFHYYFGRHCACPVTGNMPRSETVTVVKPALPANEADGVVTFTRRDIESTGATTLSQFFRYIAQNGYSRPAGFIASGAQYADFRGLGWDTHLVTINGRRTLPSANNVTSSSFDLNTIPLPAVDRVELRLDSASMRYGSDAIAGTIDIVTRRQLDTAVALRYGVAAGGAEERRTTVSVGHEGSAGRLAAMVDYFELGDLFGRERALSSDQDYSRDGGADYRARFAISSLEGVNLPGLTAPLAGVPEDRASERLSVSELTPGEPQRVSLSRYQSLVPSGRRASFVGAADYASRGVRWSADVLWLRRDARYQYSPAIASGIVSRDHPDNPFDAAVQIDALLTGAPPIQQHVESELRRAVLSARGRMRKWHWDLSVIGSSETAQAWTDHLLDPLGVSAALSASEESSALNVFAMRPGAAGVPDTVWAEKVVQRFSSSGGHGLGSIEGPLGPARLHLGVEQRMEAMQFNASVGRVERDVRGRFAHLALPLVRPDSKVTGVSELTAFAGVRRDSFSDAEAITRTHVELKWKVTDRLQFDANVAEQYRPPSLFELNLPPVSVPIQLYDPRREEVVSAVLISGGNPHLRPTTGTSTNIQATYSSPGSLLASLNYFSIRLWDRLAVMPLPILLAAEDQFPKRVRRDPTPQEVAAGQPGRLTSIDTTRDNIGRLFTTGLDLSLRKTFDVALGSITPRIDVTWIDTFSYSDLPGANALMTDRVGVASEQGTITRWRAVASVGWQRGAWAGTTYLRWIPGYRDVGGGRIGSQQLWDLNVSYSPSPHWTVTVGAIDLADTSPEFARIGAASGYDSSQWDPVGRRVMLSAKVSL